MRKLIGWTWFAAFSLASAAWCAPRYPIRVGPDHRHAVDQDGLPFLIQGDSPWSLISGLTNEEAERYLEDRRLKGFNSLIVNLIEHKFRGPVNRYGEGPFTTPGDFTTPNEEYFKHADSISSLSSFNDKYLYAALNAAFPSGSAQQIAQAIVDAGFNDEYGPGVYAGVVANRVQMIQTREDCHK